MEPKKDSPIETFEISSSSLISLGIRDCTMHIWRYVDLCSKINLVKDKKNPRHKTISLENLPSLVQAATMLRLESYDEDGCWQWWLQYILRLSQAKIMELHAPCGEVWMLSELVWVLVAYICHSIKPHTYLMFFVLMSSPLKFVVFHKSIWETDSKNTYNSKVGGTFTENEQWLH
jgi:hypothetical protein